MVIHSWFSDTQTRKHKEKISSLSQAQPTSRRNQPYQIMDTLCQILAFALLATLTQAIPHSLRDEHIAGEYSATSLPYHQHPPLLYSRHSNTTNTTFTYPHSHLPHNRSTAAWKAYQGFLGLGVIMICLPAIAALVWFVHGHVMNRKNKETSNSSSQMENRQWTDSDPPIAELQPVADTGRERV